MNDEDIYHQIISWIEETDDLSYFDLCTYAYDHDLTEWLDFLSIGKNRQDISDHLIARRKKANAAYKDTKIEAQFRMLRAQKAYLDRLRERILTEIDT